MDVVVEELSPVSKRVSVTLDSEAIARDTDKRLAKVGKRVKIHGFRPGKAPAKLLKKQYGQSVRLDAIDAAVREGLNASLERDDLQGTIHVSRPDLKSGLQDGEAVVFEFIAERLPQCETTGYEGVEVQMLDVQVSDEDVAAELERMREQHVAIVPVEDRDTVQADDVVIVSYQGVGEGEASEIHADGQQIDLSDEALLTGFAAGLSGAKIGEQARVEVELPEDFSLESIAGTKVTLEVTVSEIKRREVPELDDDFAAEVGDSETLDALRADIRKRLEDNRTRNAEVGARRRMIEKIVAANPVELPPLYVEARALEEARNRLRQLAAQGLDLSILGDDISGFAQSMKEDVAGAIHESIVMRGIAVAQKVEVSDADIETWMKEQADRSGQPLARLKAQFSVPEARDGLRSRLTYDKVVELVWSMAKVEKVAELDNPAHGEPGHLHGPDCDHDHAPAHGEPGHVHGPDCDHG